MTKTVLAWVVRRSAQMLMSCRGGVGGYGRGASAAYRGYGGSAPSASARDARIDSLLAEGSVLLRTLSMRLDRLRDARRGPGDMRGDAVPGGWDRADARPL
jgi:hypothetical protein